MDKKYEALPLWKDITYAAERRQYLNRICSGDILVDYIPPSEAPQVDTLFQFIPHEMGKPLNDYVKDLSELYGDARYLTTGYDHGRKPPVLERAKEGLIAANARAFFISRPNEAQWLNNWLNRTTKTKQQSTQDLFNKLIVMPLVNLDVAAWRRNQVVMGGAFNSDRRLVDSSDLPAAAAIAEVSRLTPENQQAVTNALLKRAVDYYRLMDAYNLPCSADSPILFKSVEDYRWALDSYPDKASRIMKALEAKPHMDIESFLRYLDAQRKYNELNNKRKLSRTGILSNQLFTDPDVNPDIAKAAFGEFVAAKKENSPSVIKKDDLGSVIDKHLKLAAYGSQDRGVVWSYWPPSRTNSLAAKLLQKFHGNVQNLRFMSLPIAESDITLHLKNNDEVTTDDCLRFVILVDLKSSGKAAFTNIVEALIYRKKTEKGAVYALSTLAIASAKDAVDYLRLRDITNLSDDKLQAIIDKFSA